MECSSVGVGVRKFWPDLMPSVNSEISDISRSTGHGSWRVCIWARGAEKTLAKILLPWKRRMKIYKFSPRTMAMGNLF